MTKEKFPLEFRKYGEFTFHSGGKSNVFCDVNSMLMDDSYIRKILDSIFDSKHYIGIATGGAIISRLISLEKGAKCTMVKDGELKGDSPLEDYVLIDDVVTTGNSLEEAIRIIGRNPKSIFVVVDRRRKNENPEVYSLFEL